MPGNGAGKRGVITAAGARIARRCTIFFNARCSLAALEKGSFAPRAAYLNRDADPKYSGHPDRSRGCG
jgi:hypothetical protein